MLDLAGDGGHGVGEEVAAAFGVEPVDRLDEAEVRRLHQVLHGLAAGAVPQGDARRDRDVHDDEPLTQPGALGLVGAFAELLHDLGGLALARFVRTTAMSVRHHDHSRSGRRDARRRPRRRRQG
jgi:hypothetical protein